MNRPFLLSAPYWRLTTSPDTAQSVMEQPYRLVIQKEKISSRIPYLDFLKFFAIACVFVGHSVEQTTDNDFWDNPIWSFIYTFHMPLFMMLCGYFFSSSLKLTFTELVKKKFIQLVVPSLTAFAIMYAWVTLTGFNPYPEIMNFSLLGFFNAVWFLKSVFFCYLIGYISILLLRNLWIAIVVSILLISIAPFGNVDYLSFMLPMFWLGYLCKKYQNALTQYRKQWLIISALAFTTLLPFWSGRLTVYMVPIDFVNWQTGTIDTTNLGTTLYRMIVGMAGSMTFFLLAPWIYGKIAFCSFAATLNKMGKSTLGLYMLQTFLLESVIHNLGIHVTTAGSFLTGFLFATLELFLCYQTVLLLRKNRYTRLLFLGEKTNRSE